MGLRLAAPMDELAYLVERLKEVESSALDAGDSLAAGDAHVALGTVSSHRRRLVLQP